MLAQHIVYRLGGTDSTGVRCPCVQQKLSVLNQCLGVLNGRHGVLVSREISSEGENRVRCQDLFVTLTALGPLTTNSPKKLRMMMLALVE